MVHPDLDITSLQGLIGPGDVTFWISEGASTPTGLVYSQSAKVFTNTAHWTGMMIVGSDLLIYGVSNPGIATAPNTPTLENQVVNVHKMDQAKNTGLTDYSDIGPNLLQLFQDKPFKLSGVGVAKVPTTLTDSGDPKDFSSLIVMNEGSIGFVSSTLAMPSFAYWFTTNMLYNTTGGGEW